MLLSLLSLFSLFYPLVIFLNPFNAFFCFFTHMTNLYRVGINGKFCHMLSILGNLGTFVCRLQDKMIWGHIVYGITDHCMSENLYLDTRVNCMRKQLQKPDKSRASRSNRRHCRFLLIPYATSTV